MAEPSRRQFMGAVSALAATRWADQDLDPENVEDWEPVTLGDGWSTTGTFEARAMYGGAVFPFAHFDFPDSYDGIAMKVRYDTRDVMLELEALNDDCSVSYLADLSPEDAKNLAAAIYQAAWELENRPVEGE